MTKKEISILLGIMQAAYPKFYGNNFDVRTAVNLGMKC